MNKKKKKKSIVNGEGFVLNVKNTESFKGEGSIGFIR
jgi:hypothetical protein